MFYRFYINTTDYNDEKSIWQPAAYFASQVPRLNKVGGFQGYFYIRANGISGNLLCPNEFANATNMRAVIEPVLDKMATMPGMSPEGLIKSPIIDPSAISGLLGSLQNAFGGAASAKGTPPKDTEAKGMSGMSLTKRHGPGEDMKKPMYGILDQDSILLGEEELTHPKLAEALEKSMRRGDTGQYRAHLVGGGKIHENRHIDSSVNPAWREAYVHLMVTGNDRVYEEPLRALSSNGGPAYINEVRILYALLIRWRLTKL